MNYIIIVVGDLNAAINNIEAIRTKSHCAADSAT